VYSVRQHTNHPGYVPWDQASGRPEYADITVIETYEDIQGPIARVLNVNYFSSYDVRVEGNHDATLIGWGATNNAGNMPSRLQRASSSLLSNCPMGGGYDRRAFICSQSPSQGACGGDSGGPLLVRDAQGHFVQVGVLSGSNCEAGFSYYQDTRWFGDWIRSQLS
jgi:secreted trypsin-like serine protease